ncbi:MAG: hypothetical protein K9L62_16540 [Vallitaleaceae bacterium]|nr:hypothetical protein [Vallitaleaceae bacterium]
MDELKVIKTVKILKKEFAIYGTSEEPFLFLAKDVASWIGLTNVTDMVSRVDDDEVTKLRLGSQQGQVNMLTEDGLYEALMQSRKPIAKLFKREVKAILKSIRQDGAYIQGEEKLKSSEMLVDTSTGEQYNNITNSALHIEAIKCLNVDNMKRFIEPSLYSYGEKSDSEKKIIYSHSITITKTPTTKFNNVDDLYKAINSIDLYKFLGIDTGFINCILPEHNDSSPSAHIYSADDGTHLYKCFGCVDKGYTIITLVSRLAKCSRKKAIDFIKNVYNYELVKSEWQQEAIEEFMCIKEYIFSDVFEIEYPTLYKRLKNKMLNLNALLDVAIKNVYEGNDYKGKPVFFCSYKELEKVFGTTSPNSIGNTINLFALLGILSKLPEENIPEHMLIKAKHISALKGYKRLPNHYIISDFGFSLNDSDSKAIKLKDNNFTMKGMSREWILRTFGIDVANEIYPQYKFENERGVSKKSDEKTIEIIKVVISLIESQGYATENEVVEILRSNYGKSKTEIQIKRSLQEILDSYDLTRIRANNQIKTELGIARNGYPFLIRKNKKTRMGEYNYERI